MQTQLAEPQDLEQFRPDLTGHCYRMLGSIADADDAVQETMVRAWRGLARFDGRASLRTWLHRIATNVCLDAIGARRRRARPIEDGPVGTTTDDLVERPREHWLEPVPDAAVVPPGTDPATALMLRQQVRLAFVAALQTLPARQRAALLLTEIVGCTAAEAAEALDTSVASVNSALQRARATLGDGAQAPDDGELSEAQRELLDGYVEAFLRYDVDALTHMMREDAVLSMPPYTLWLQGPDVIGQWLLGRGFGCKGSRLITTHANGLPAFAQYRPRADGSGFDAWALVLLELDGDRIASWTSFLDVETLFPRFGLPMEVD